MKRILNVLLISLLLALQSGCANRPSEVTKAADSSEFTVAGEITEIKQVEIKANIAQDILGSGIGMLVGSTVGSGNGRDVAEIAGLFIGSEVADEIAKRNVDQLTIKGSDGKLYTCLVKENSYKVGENVRFNLDSDKQKIVAISKF